MAEYSANIMPLNPNRLRSAGQPTESLLAKRLKAALLTDDQVAVVLKILDDTCSYCQDGDSDCQCWNEE